MGMTLYWTVSEGGEKIFKTQMKNAGDTVKMREDFREYLLKNEREYLLKNGIGENDLNQNTLLVSKKNPFYTAKTNGVLKKLGEDGKLVLGYFEDRDGKLKLSRWRIAGTDKFESNRNDPNRRFFREDPTQGDWWNARCSRE
jgi:hypothetical protein